MVTGVTLVTTKTPPSYRIARAIKAIPELASFEGKDILGALRMIKRIEKDQPVNIYKDRELAILRLIGNKLGLSNV